MMSKTLRVSLIAVVVLWATWPAASSAHEPIVNAVLFWSQTCPHCHYVIEEVLPPLQVRLKMLENNRAGSAEVYHAAVQTFDVPSQRWGVPTMVVGDQVLVGSRDIPEQLPGLLERYLASGGMGYPPLPGLEQAAGTDLFGAAPRAAGIPAEPAAR